MTDGDLVKFHGGPRDGHSMWVPFEDEGPPDVLRLPDLPRPLDMGDFNGPTKPRPSALTYNRRGFISDVDHAWHYDFEEPL